ncbi:hypothetical protein [Rhizorhabdus wittichii]|uniref:hypothetical protein n=1 Tax=Rhizorhabdus wittichii TaxID=160791 RepID=UPI000304D1CB|nr:hypothetical protein [Rhizorhabdus wittichii]
MELTILQTSDAFKYSRMLRATSRTAIEYCRRHGFAYESFVGIKRGFHGAHATFNRMFMLTELIERGYRGWTLYMDADAYIYDLAFDLRAYLADKQRHSAIMTTIPGETVPWHINAGVLFFNLAHPSSADLIAEWKRRFMAIPEERLRTLTSVWDYDNDQTMLYQSLDQNVALRDPVLFEDPMIFNHHEARFIRQFLHSLDTDIERRTDTIATAVARVLGDAGDGSPASSVTAALYRLILKREPDPGSASYSHLIAAKGLEHGIPEVVGLLLDSPEYRTRIGAELALRDTEAPGKQDG